MAGYDYFDVGNEVLIGSDFRYLNIVDIFMQERTILTFSDDGLVPYTFDEVLNVIAVNDFTSVNRSEQERIITCLKNAYSKDTLIELLEDMKDPYNPLPKGLKGKVQFIDSMGQIHVSWENGSSLAVVYGVDKIAKISSKS